MSARFLFDAAVVGSAAEVSRAKAALRRACGELREKRTHTDGEKHRAGEKYVRREERKNARGRNGIGQESLAEYKPQKSQGKRAAR